MKWYVYLVVNTINNIIYNLEIKFAILFNTYKVEEIEPADYEDLINF